MTSAACETAKGRTGEAVLSFNLCQLGRGLEKKTVSRRVRIRAQ